MTGNSDILKGRIKEAAGTLIGSEKLRKEGKTDQAVGKAKQVVEKIADDVAKQMDEITENTSK